LVRRAIVRLLADEALQQWFPTLEACCGIADVVGADAVIVVVPEPS
jgi:hypothetical protein